MMDDALRDKIEDLLERRFTQIHEDFKSIRIELQEFRAIGVEIRIANSRIDQLKSDIAQIYADLNGDHGVKSRIRRIEDAIAEQRPMNRGIGAIAMAILTAIGAAVAGFIAARLNP